MKIHACDIQMLKLTKLRIFLLNSYKSSQALRPSDREFNSLAAK